ncbi:OmpA family protein [Sulfitobacter mediterraneus]|jgi:outer membrane protein OmpA-like peptidoglycan-associated protein|uniref:Outer membrane protein OmpA-like peptidoglycan-associated protein n=1 Tax=Sulfitobacter mediterraneus TaxID=83219 RepID=A0A2T6CJC8_9RHOB|nr:OmpA family protein [Sulfitobacter mediterraneus]KIN78556.1 OmpA family domain protein [Sulfitobacter mediterraneus KCTC 32188]MBM1310180.1 OmpA family protein [Sulfitobacter mediterraneus]MBM1314064.1 OmpA family protein [Sulfitobacter mediterraneus]MBM1322424.1 OmpA family protein [Sulfitobacter mediterraneus]MBM1326336.1 OmpA family protein [Sulfitobacter mediterraneus]
MISSKLTLASVLAGALALSACTDPGRFGAQPGDPNQKTKNGALIGAGAGALLGALSKGDGNRGDGALKGALIGGALGAGVGYALDKQEAELRQQMGNDVVITNTGDRLIVTLPQDILFAVDSTAVQPGLMGDLRTLANSLQSYPNSTVQVIGHTDSDGDAAYNQQLSEGRAYAVANVLYGNGVPTGRVQAFGRGESQPIASNLTPAGKAQNRRVEIVILPNA